MRSIPLSALLTALALGSFSALAHTPLCACYDMGDGTVLCEGGFSDGSSAAGVGIRVVDSDGNALLDAEMNQDSEFEFAKPDGDYTVVFDAGPGHAIEIDGQDIVE
jgi:type 1 fimbria pilin